MDIFANFLTQLALTYGPPLALGVAGLTVVAAVFRLLVKLARRLFAASANATRSASPPPKAVLLAVSGLALVLTGLGAWTYYIPPTIEIEVVEVPKETIRTVIQKEYNTVDLNKVEAGRIEAEQRATAAVNAAASAKATLEKWQAEEQARKRAEEVRQAAEAARKHAESLVAAKKSSWKKKEAADRDDENERSRLYQQIDQLHADGVARETQYQVDYRRYRSYCHHGEFAAGRPTLYHKSCSTCNQTCQIRMKIDAIDERHPGGFDLKLPPGPND